MFWATPKDNKEKQNKNLDHLARVRHTQSPSQPQIYTETNQVFWATPYDNKKEENKNLDHLARDQTHSHPPSLKNIPKPNRCFGQPHKTIKKKRTKTSITWPEVTHTQSSSQPQKYTKIRQEFWAIQ
jgi:hypothetical protein